MSLKIMLVIIPINSASIRNQNFDCDACGMEGRYTVNICSICQLWVHQKCTSLPVHLKTRAHPHLLMLRWSFEGTIMIHHEMCKLCYKKMYRSNCFYYCEPCRYITHHTCAVMVDIDDHDDDETIEETSKADHPIHADLQDKIEHFSHQHLLTLISSHHEVIKYDSDDDSTLNCDGCMRPISPTDAFYSCMQQQQEEQPNCHFFLHTNCARLPTKMRHRFHPEHPVTLLSKAPSIDGVFKCDILNTFSQGFVYNCEQCSFYLDLQCNFLPDSIKHEVHDHRLILNRAFNLMCCFGCGLL